MGFPCQYPDVNPIEYFWENLKQEKVKEIPKSLNNL